ncbi:hypothetical protein FQN57_000285 [Myotisia sp. PD_48]|nr:hypothetical protein FQN57_000285 [Myotisia sp. PD_48]
MLVNPQDESPFSLPGFTLPLNFGCDFAGPNGLQLFKTALNVNDLEDTETVLPLLSLRKITISQLINHITDKRRWNEKVQDDTIADRWKAEALSSGKDITPQMIEWIIQDLHYKAQDQEALTYPRVYNGDVVKFDLPRDSNLRLKLKHAVRALENIPEAQKDYHPGSNQQVVNLVHPSLFPLVYGKSRILPDTLINLDNCLDYCGAGEIIPIPPKADTELNPRRHYGYPAPSIRLTDPYSRSFQWLPCNVGFTSGGYCKIATYINNLHHKDHRDLYECIELVLDEAIPLLNITLSALKKGNFAFDHLRMSQWEHEFVPEHLRAGPAPQTTRIHARVRWEKKTIKPEPELYSPPNTIWSFGDKVDLIRDFGHRELQVIVKLANIELTPEKPEYEGGVWHVEGQLNEHICATVLYYYSTENITPSYLSFRQISNTDNHKLGGYHNQDEHIFIEDVYGCEQHGSSVQEVGSVLCTENRLVAFPNILQHRVEKFKLQDPSRPGHRKILALFLVDPNIRVISTANVPPQQWPSVHGTGPILDLEEAKELRLRLMEERKVFVVTQTAAFKESHKFSLCEH